MLGYHGNFLYLELGDLAPRGARPPDPPCAQARSDRTAREYEDLMARNMMSNHTDMQDKYCGHSNDICPIQSQYTKVAAVGRHHKRGGAAFGRATSFVVSFVVAMNRVHVVAADTIFVLRLSKSGRTVGRTGSRLDGWSVGRTN